MVMFSARNGAASNCGARRTPYLYTLLLYAAQMPRVTVVEVVGCRVGFREVEIRDGQIHVNGAPIFLKGVNRHEHEPETGHTVSTESMV